MNPDSSFEVAHDVQSIDVRNDEKKALINIPCHGLIELITMSESGLDQNSV